MAELRKIPWWKWALAGVGVCTLGVGAIWLGSFALAEAGHRPSDLINHPERQDEINAGRQAEALAERLDLDPTQQAQAAEIFLRFRSESKALFTEQAGNVPARVMGRLRGIQTLDRELEAILRPEQRERYHEVRNERIERMTDMRKAMQIVRENGGFTGQRDAGEPGPLQRFFPDGLPALTVPAPSPATPNTEQAP